MNFRTLVAIYLARSICFCFSKLLFRIGIEDLIFLNDFSFFFSGQYCVEALKCQYYHYYTACVSSVGVAAPRRRLTKKDVLKKEHSIVRSQKG